MTVWQVVAWLEAKRAKVRSEIAELQGEGVKVVVDPELLFLCELLGLVVELETGQITGVADERVVVNSGYEVLLVPNEQWQAVSQ